MSFSFGLFRSLPDSTILPTSPFEAHTCTSPISSGKRFSSLSTDSGNPRSDISLDAEDSCRMGSSVDLTKMNSIEISGFFETLAEELEDMIFISKEMFAELKVSHLVYIVVM